MMQVPTVQQPQYMTPTYNAVKIDVNNPQVNAPGYTSQGQPQLPAYATSPYEVPKASVYEVPNNSVYGTPENFNNPPAAQVAPAVPAPTIVSPTVAPAVKPSQPAPAPEAKTPAAPVATPAPAPEAKAPEQAAPAAKPQTVDVKTPEKAAPQLDVNAFLGKLSSENLDEQANGMESIADLAQNSPDKATALLDTKVIDTLLGVMSKDTSKMAGPSPKQLEIREKMINNQPVTEQEKSEANAITPMEQAERNKQYAMYTVAILQKLYSSEIQKMNNATVPLTELPGAAAIVEQVKNNPNPMVRASGIDALSYVQCPEYKDDLNTIFTIAKNDKDPNVQQAAAKGLEKLAQLQAPAASATAAPAAPVEAKASAAPEVKPEKAAA